MTNRTTNRTIDEAITEWNYHDAYLRHPILPGQQAVFDNGSIAQVHNLLDPLPAMLKQADCVFIDPPWNLGNLNAFYTKAGRIDYQASFEAFYLRIFACIREIAPKTCYVEVGKEYIAEFLMQMKKMFRHVTFYNSSYYHQKSKFCYVIQGSLKRIRHPLDGVDEEDIIKYICEHENYEHIGDFCMGKGLVGKYAYRAGRKFIGTELNPKRLSVLLESIASMGGKYMLKSNDAILP